MPVRRRSALVTGRPPVKVLLVAAVLAVPACTAATAAPTVPGISTAGTVPGSPLTARGTTRPTSGGPVAVRGLCLDPTDSTRAAFSEDVKARVAELVEAWTPPDADPRDGSDAVPGLSLTVRVIDTASYSTDAVALTVTVPPVPALASRPDLTADGVLAPGGPYDTWTRERERAQAARAAAREAAASAARALRALRLDHATRSGISGCLSALAQTLPPGDDRRIALASDLDENTAVQVAGDFGKAPLLVVQPCPDGDARRCTELLARAEGLLRALDTGPLTPVRPEAAGAALRAWTAPR